MKYSRIWQVKDSILQSLLLLQELEINGAKIVFSDLPTLNGLIHVIDKVCTNLCNIILTVLLMLTLVLFLCNIVTSANKVEGDYVSVSVYVYVSVCNQGNLKSIE